MSPAFFLVSLGVLAADLCSKSWAWGFVEGRAAGNPLAFPRGVPVIEDFFYIVREENTGTIWGLFRDHNLVLTVLRCLMILALLLFAWKTDGGKWPRLLGIGLVTGGALGNLHDNLFDIEGVRNPGAVRDFLDFYIPLPWRGEPYHYPTFNLADSCILTGAILLFIALHREDRKAARDRREALQATGT